MFSTNGLEKIQALLPEHQLKIIEKPLNNPDIKWFKGELKYKNLPDFKVDHRGETLKNNKSISFMTYETSKYVPLRVYDEKRKEEYRSRKPSVKVKVVYRFLNLMKIEYIFGYDVLKKSEELHSDFVETDKLTLLFRFDFVEQHWVPMTDKKRWEEMKSEIEELKEDELIRTARKYFDLKEKLDELNIDSALKKFPSWEAVMDFLLEISDAITEYQELRNLISEIDDAHFSLLKKEIDETKKKIIAKKDWFQKVGPHDVRCLGVANTGLNADMKDDFLNKNGYWVRDGRLLANVAEEYSLYQQAEQPRNDGTRRILEKTLLKTASKRQEKEAIIYLYDSDFLETMKEFKPQKK